MIEKIGPIKNPLTIIAIFAAIAEISGTVVLPFIAPANQATYVWFLIVFPILLIVLFFLTLNFNHKVLYAPSDYQNEDNFLKSLPRATLAEKAMKIETEIAEAAAASQLPPLSEKNLPTQTETDGLGAMASLILNHQQIRRSAHTSYVFAEELIFRKLRNEFSTEIQREVKLGTEHPYIFDGVVREGGITTFIEVKLLGTSFMGGVQLRDVFKRIEEAAKPLQIEQAGQFRVLLALAFNEGHPGIELVSSRVERVRSEFSFPIEVRFYNLAELEQEFGAGA